MTNIDELCVNTLRFLAVDAVEKAHSGHPGLPLGAAPMAYVLWNRFLRHNPQNPQWMNRDRFILSAGHGSALLYALLHVYGYGLSHEELKQFRQWGSRTPGHPEYGRTPGVEATTGPLGQGFAMGVGMAMAERFLANCFNTSEFPVVDHYTYALVSDGDLMEGVSAEAASLAGTLGLNKLVYLYDDNHISIEGETDLAFTENIQRRFEAYRWKVIRVPDGNDLALIEQALHAAHAEQKMPTLITVRTHIGYGSPKQDTGSAHGEPLGTEALQATKQYFNWPTQPTFYIPKRALTHFRLAVKKGKTSEREWTEMLTQYHQAKPNLALQFDQVLKGTLPRNWKSYLPAFSEQDSPIATRNASGKVMNVLSQKLHAMGKASHHFLVGGSADLAPSTKTVLMGYGDLGFTQDCAHNVHYGVREHAMGAIANGMALHSRFIPYTGTFLVFSDYMRPALRLAALMQTHVIFVYTHDSIALGEDGPTHQPIEQLMGLRSIPGLTVIRPADANETAVAWRVAIEREGPVALIFSRQKLPVLDPTRYPTEKVSRGAYTLNEFEAEPPEVILVATGSEVHLALAAHTEIQQKGVKARVVSMPSWELFEEQPKRYKKQVFPRHIPKLAIEAGSTLGWKKYVGDRGEVIGLDRFGASAPGDTVYCKLGFNVTNVTTHALRLVKR